MSLPDVRNAALIAQGFTGNDNEKMIKWALDNGATSYQYNEAIRQVLLANGAISNNFNDAWNEFLIDQGYTGAFNDMEHDFWSEGGTLYAFYAPLTTSLSEGRNTLDSFTTDVTDNEMTVTDFEGLVKNTKGDEARFVGARRVENICPNGDTPETWSSPPLSAVKGVLDPFGGNNAIRLTTFVNLLSYSLLSTIIPIGAEITTSVWLRSQSGDRTLSLINTNVGTPIDITLTSEWQRFSTPVGVASAAVAFGFWDIAVTTGSEIDYFGWQIEIVDGQANQNPSEYVSVGAGTEAEEIPDTTFSTWTDPTYPDGWTITTDGTPNAGVEENANGLRFYSDGTAHGIGYDGTLVEGKLYAYRIEIHSITSSYPKLINGDGALIENLSSVGVHTGTFIYIAGFYDLGLFRVSATDVVISSMSVKEIDHGSNVDGVKYFDTENGNTVSSNVVTQATGTAIADVTLKGVLIEEESTNVVFPSEDITAFAGVRMGTFTADAIQSPSGAIDADVLVDDGTTNNTHWAYSNSTVRDAAIEQWTASIYVKAKVFDRIQLRVISSNSAKYAGRTFDLSTGTSIASVNGTWTLQGYGIEFIGDGWYRIWVTAETDNLSEGIRLGIWLDNGVSVSYNAGATSGDMYFWGAQLEELPYPTSYIPTAGSTVTRSVTTLQYDNTSGAIDNTAGSVLTEVSGVTFRAGQNSNILSFNNNDARNALYMQATARLTSRSNAGDVSYPATVIPLLSNIKIGAYYSATDNVLGTVVDGVADLIPAASFNHYTHGDQKITLNASTYQNGSIKNLKFYNKNLGVDKMKELTS